MLPWYSIKGHSGLTSVLLHCILMTVSVDIPCFFHEHCCSSYDERFLEVIINYVGLECFIWHGLNIVLYLLSFISTVKCLTVTRYFYCSLLQYVSWLLPCHIHLISSWNILFLFDIFLLYFLNHFVMPIFWIN